MSFVNKLIAKNNHLPALQEEDRVALLPLRKGSILQRATSTKVIKRAFNSFIHGNPRFSIPDIGLNVAQACALKHLLSLPTSKPLLSTTIAWTGYPVARKENSVFPTSQCAVHTWLNPDMLWHLTFLIAEELHWYSKGLWALPPQCLPPDVREMLHVTLKPFLTVFGEEKGLHRCSELPNVEIIKYPLDAFKEAGKGRECVACTLHLIFRNEAAVNALATLCKGRKKHRRKWPQLLAFLEPTNVEAEEDCFRRWRREGKDVRRARNRVRRWKECGGMNEMSVLQNAETELVPLVWSPTKDAEFDRNFAAGKAAMNPDEAGSRLQNKRMTVLEYVLDDRRTEDDDEGEQDADGLCEDEWDDEPVPGMDSPTLVASSSEGGSSPKDSRPKISPAYCMSDSFGLYDPSKLDTAEEENCTSGLRDFDQWSAPKSPPRHSPPRSR